ncbi:DNA polymerase subunit B [uncultured Caudovirales phage]|uniref:DNA polymerase subunit B n=1 Tax=uncultured Caudovirales phage TaxID=2100421 RepID=A0A6J5L417_9CAUD|nr:DNA polymerase subunit B [uncultured Caudovirales phage]
MNYTTHTNFEIVDLGVQELDVYDIEVEDNHNFFANDILVHNSIYLSLETLVEKLCAGKTDEQKIQYMDKVCEEVVQPFIDKGFAELADYMNAYAQKMVMKREVLADKGIFVQKKMYILNVHNSEGVQYAEPKLKVKGLAMVRSTTPAVVRDKLKESIKVILSGDQTALRKFIIDYEEEFNKLSVEEISAPSGLNGMEVYKDGGFIYAKGTPIHVRGSLLHNYHVKRLGLTKKYALITDSDKIKYVYIKKQNPFHEDVIAYVNELPVEFGLHAYIDYERQFNKVFVKAVDNIVKCMGWNIDTQANLEDFFG